MRKYNYFVDGIQVKRNEFFEQLRNWSQKSRRIDTIAGWCGIDIMEFDEKKYNAHVRDINNGIGLTIVEGRASKSFRRRLAK